MNTERKIMKKNFDDDAKPISEKELIESRQQEMQSMLPNLFTRVGEHVVYSKRIVIKEVKK